SLARAWWAARLEIGRLRAHEDLVNVHSGRTFFRLSGGSLGARQQFGAVVAPQRVELQRHRRAEPHRVDAVVVDRIVGQRVNQHVKDVAAQHQPSNDGLKLLDSVRHDLLLAKVARRVNDQDILHLLKLMLKASGKRGVPQGGVISPLLSNIYLTEVDAM